VSWLERERERKRKRERERDNKMAEIATMLASSSSSSSSSGSGSGSVGNSNFLQMATPPAVLGDIEIGELVKKKKINSGPNGDIWQGSCRGSDVIIKEV